MKKKLLIVSIICTIPIVILGCNRGNVNEEQKKIVSEKAKGNNQEGEFYLYKDSKEQYINVPNLIGDNQISNFKFALNEDKSVNGFDEIENFDMTLLNNINSFKDIENILKVDPYIGYREEFVDIKLDESISNPNIILSRAKFIGELASNFDYNLAGIPRNGEDIRYMLNCVTVIAKLDGLGMNSNNEVKFRLLNYLIDNTENIKQLNSPKEIFEYNYILNYLMIAFMNSPSGTFAYLRGVDSLLEYRLNVVFYEEATSIKDGLLDGGCNWIEQGLEKMKTYK
ncbi:MAG: hypothetical protein ACRC41_05690 [Sarcina sp.]